MKIFLFFSIIILEYYIRTNLKLVNIWKINLQFLFDEKCIK